MLQITPVVQLGQNHKLAKPQIGSSLLATQNLLCEKLSQDGSFEETYILDLACHNGETILDEFFVRL